MACHLAAELREERAGFRPVFTFTFFDYSFGGFLGVFISFGAKGRHLLGIGLLSLWSKQMETSDGVR